MSRSVLSLIPPLPIGPNETDISSPQKSCLKAFHVSCAIADPKTRYEVYEVTEFPPMPLDGSAPESLEPIKRMNVELLCELHNPVRHHHRSSTEDFY